MNLNSYRSEFPITEQYTFLNHASVSAVNRRVVEAVHNYLEQVQVTPFDHLREQMDNCTEQFKQRVAMFINAARADEIVVMQNTALGINTIANSLPLKAGDNVLLLDGDYPAVLYPWLNLAPKGILTKIVPQTNGGLDLNRLEARIDSRTRAIALSSAMFATGYKNDLEAVGQLCQQRNIYFVVDCIQTLGAFPLDVQACHIDFVACGSQKWLLSTMGSGFMYCRHELLDELQPGAYVGTMGTVDPFNFLDYNFTLQPSSERFSVGTANQISMLALNASMALIEEAGLEQISTRILSLTDSLIEDLQKRGYRILTNLDRQHRCGIVIVEVPDPQAAYEKLMAAKVVTSVRGAGLRIAPHFYNTTAEVLRVGEVLGNL